MLSDKQWKSLSNYIRTKIVSLFDPGSLFAEEPELDKTLQYVHKGFYIGLVSAEGQDIVREGLLQEGLSSLKKTADIVVKNLHSKIQTLDMSVSAIATSTFHFSVVTDVQYIADPLDWNESVDGVYFMWGQNYRGLYLPYQIKKMGVSKVEVLDKLCCWEAGLCSNLWRLACGLCYRLQVQSFTS